LSADTYDSGGELRIKTSAAFSRNELIEIKINNSTFNSAVLFREWQHSTKRK